MPEHAAENSVVVGVDGSAASMAALRWAVAQARVLDAEVVAVHAWEPTHVRLAPYAPVSQRPTPAEQRVEAARVLASTLREVFGPRVGDGIRAVVVVGPAARVLRQQARGARLLVLGHRSDAPHRRPALGPTGRACLLDATVPVVVVPATGKRPALRAVGVA